MTVKEYQALESEGEAFINWNTAWKPWSLLQDIPPEMVRILEERYHASAA